MYAIQSCTSLQCHSIGSYICRMHVCLAVTCHLHVWQNDRDLLRATAVTRGGVGVGGWGGGGGGGRGEGRGMYTEIRVSTES